MVDPTNRFKDVVRRVTLFGHRPESPHPASVALATLSADDLRPDHQRPHLSTYRGALPRHALVPFEVGVDYVREGRHQLVLGARTAKHFTTPAGVPIPVGTDVVLKLSLRRPTSAPYDFEAPLYWLEEHAHPQTGQAVFATVVAKAIPLNEFLVNGQPFDRAGMWDYLKALRREFGTDRVSAIDLDARQFGMLPEGAPGLTAGNRLWYEFNGRRWTPVLIDPDLAIR